MWWRVSSWCRRLIHHSYLESSTAFLTEHIWIESSDLYNFLSGYGSISKNSPQTATVRGQRPSKIIIQEEQVRLWSVHFTKSFSGDLSYNCAPQLYWRFLLPEQEQQSQRSVCTFTDTPCSLPSPAAEAEAHGPFWFYCSGKTASVKAEGTAQKRKSPDFEPFRADARTASDQAGAAQRMVPADCAATGQRWSAQHRHNEIQSFTSVHYVQLTKATVFSKVTGNFLKTANVALGLVKMRSQYLPFTTPVLLKACHQKTAATWMCLPWNKEIGKTARKEKIELKDPCISKARIKREKQREQTGAFLPVISRIQDKPCSHAQRRHHWLSVCCCCSITALHPPTPLQLPVELEIWYTAKAADSQRLLPCL